MQVSGRNGFTLIEVVGALLIFTIGVLLAGFLSSDLTTLMRNSTLRSEVVAIGQATLDSLAVRGYANIAVGTTGPNQVVIEDRTYSRTWTVTQSGARTREILVQVVSSVSGGPTFSRKLFVAEEW